jgi:hypothetical protein
MGEKKRGPGQNRGEGTASGNPKIIACYSEDITSFNYENLKYLHFILLHSILLERIDVIG